MEANSNFVVGYVTERFPNVDSHMSVSSDNAEFLFAMGFTKRNRTRKCCRYSNMLLHIVLTKRIGKSCCADFTARKQDVLPRDYSARGMQPNYVNTNQNQTQILAALY